MQAKSAGRQSAVPETPDSDASESSLADDADASVESDPEFFVNGAKYFVWLGEVGERETSTALYVYKIVSQDETNVKAYALHASKGCSAKSCIR